MRPSLKLRHDPTEEQQEHKLQLSGTKEAPIGPKMSIIVEYSSLHMHTSYYRGVSCSETSDLACAMMLHHSVSVWGQSVTKSDFKYIVD